MTFQVRDLMVHLDQPQLVECPKGCTASCGDCTQCSWCTMGTCCTASPGVYSCPEAQAVNELDLLQAQLSRQLDQI